MSLLARVRGLLHRTRPGPPTHPPPGVQPTVEWQVCGLCNYDCSYCIQSRRHRRGAPTQAVVEAIVQGLGRLPGSWEVKLSGGEPFAFPGLLAWVIPGLLRWTPHDISLLTNLSASEAELEQLCGITGPRLRVVSISLHREAVTLEQFLARAHVLRGLLTRHNPRSSLVVNTVLVPGRVRDQRAIRAALAAAGLRYFPQLMKTRGGVYPYPPEEQALIEELTDGRHDPRTANWVPSYTGRRCAAGVWYFVVDQRGRAFTCRSGKRLAGAAADEEAAGVAPAESEAGAYLGSFPQNSFRRWSRGIPCPYPNCPCTVPVARGMVHDLPAVATPAPDDGP